MSEKTKLVLHVTPKELQKLTESHSHIEGMPEKPLPTGTTVTSHGKESGYAVRIRVADLWKMSGGSIHSPGGYGTSDFTTAQAKELIRQVKARLDDADGTSAPE